jgi:putative ABC transport system ATP-binding protein
VALIEVRDATKVFTMGKEELRALDGVSLDVAQGEMVGITGPSGCGKSTLMNILGLLDQPTEGTYRLDGKFAQSLTDDESARLRNEKIGFVFQSFNLLPRASALRNVEMPMVYSANYDPSFSHERSRAAAREALERVGLGDRMEHKPSELSGGQRQRVAIARALVNKPRLLMADEPTGNLDSKSGESILKLFEQLNSEGVTIVMVTHDPNIAARCKRVIAMIDGKVRTDSRAGS